MGEEDGKPEHPKKDLDAIDQDLEEIEKELKDILGEPKKSRNNHEQDSQ